MNTVSSTTFIEYATDVLYPEFFQKHEKQLESTFDTISKEFHEGLKEIKNAKKDYLKTSSLLKLVIPAIDEIFNQSILEPVNSETIDVLESKLDLLEKTLTIKHLHAVHVIKQVQLTAEIFNDQLEVLKEKQNNLVNTTNYVHQVHEIFKNQESHEAKLFKQADDQRLKFNQQKFLHKQERRKHRQKLESKQNELEIKKRQMEENAQLEREKFEQRKSRAERSFELKKQQLNNEKELYLHKNHVKRRRPK